MKGNQNFLAFFYTVTDSRNHMHQLYLFTTPATHPITLYIGPSNQAASSKNSFLILIFFLTTCYQRDMSYLYSTRSIFCGQQNTTRATNNRHPSAKVSSDYFQIQMSWYILLDIRWSWEQWCMSWNSKPAPTCSWFASFFERRINPKFIARFSTTTTRTTTTRK